jgi:hypothetical protein
MGTNLDELVANMRAGKPLVSEPKLAPPVPPPAPPFVPPMPLSTGDAPPISAPVPPIAPPAPPPPEPIVVLEVPAHTEEISMSAEAKPALRSKTIWGVLILVMAPFVGQIGEALQVAGSTAPSPATHCRHYAHCHDVYRGHPGTIGRMAAASRLSKRDLG